MTVDQLPSGNYRVRYTLNGKRKSITLDHNPTQKELRRIESDLAEKVKTYSTNTMTFADAFSSYMEAKYNVLSPTTRRGYQTAFRRLSQGFVRLPINDIEQLTIQTEINRISSQLAPKTVKNTHGMISAVMAMFRPNLHLRTTLPQAQRKEFHIPTEEEVKLILEEVKGSRYYVPFVLGVCGMRRSEICAALPEDIDGNFLHINKAKVQDENQNFVIKTTKTTESTRKIYLSDELIALIREQGEIYTGNDTSLYKALKRAQKKLCIEEFRFHDLRAYFASYAHAKGIPDQMIQEAGGWKTDSTMKRVYRHTMLTPYEESQKFLSEMLQK